MDSNLTDALGRHASQRPDAVAVDLRGRPISYRTMEALAWRAAMLFARRGVRPGDVVATIFDDEFLALVATLGIARIGATVLGLAESEPPTLRARTLAAARAKLVATDSPTLDAAGLPVLVTRLDDLEAGSTPVDATIGIASPTAPWLLIFVSGSTGRPKQIALTHRVSLARTVTQQTAIPISADDRVLCASPIHFAITRQRYLEALSAGATVVLFDRAGVNPFQASRRQGATVLHASVMHLENLLRGLPEGATRVLGSLRVLRVGGSTVSDALRQRIVRCICPNLYIAYSMNEFGIATISRPDDVLRTSGSVGRPVAGIELRVTDPRGTPLPAGQVGLIRVRGPGLVTGYVDDDEATRRAFRDGWFVPGDLGVLTAGGELIYRGRADHMMIMNGINIYPAEIEQAMTGHPAVRDAAAMPLASPVHQEVPVCAVALRDGCPVSEEELLEYARQRLGARMPRRIVVLERIPRTDQGKLVRAELAREVLQVLAPSPREDGRRLD